MSFKSTPFKDLPMTKPLLDLNESAKNMTPQKLLQEALTHTNGSLVLANSLSMEDVALMHMLSELQEDFHCFTLDTGRLNPETYNLLDRLQERFPNRIQVYFPNQEQIEKVVSQNGINFFYNSLEDRKLCCQLRKVEPLQRALKPFKVWVTGLRKEQSPERKDLSFIEEDNANGLLKINPLLNWNFNQVKNYITKNNLPYNTLYDQGYKSIGCAPCTRAIGPNDPERAGRWWWEDPSSKECGLHTKKT